MALAAYGTMSTLDTLASNFQTVAQYGEDRAYEQFQVLLDRHNALSNEMLTLFVDRGTERLARYGTGASMAMEAMDEFGTPHPQKVRAGSTVGFPLLSFQGALQWTRKYFVNRMVSEWAAQVTSMLTADKVNLSIAIKKALFTGTNYSFNDYLVDNLGSSAQLPIKALANADSTEIPVGPNGESFDGSAHTHYLYSAALDAASQTALINTIVEHFGDGTPVVYINRAQEATYRGLSGFTAYLDTRIVGAISSNQAPGVGLSPTSIFNRAIGIFNGAEVWVKPWIPSNYQVCMMLGGQKPLMFRERSAGSGVLQLVAEDESYPLRARVYEREFGISAWNRVAAAVNYSNSGSAYAAPAITSDLG